MIRVSKVFDRVHRNLLLGFGIDITDLEEPLLGKTIVNGDLIIKLEVLGVIAEICKDIPNLATNTQEAYVTLLSSSKMELDLTGDGSLDETRSYTPRN